MQDHYIRFCTWLCNYKVCTISASTFIDQMYRVSQARIYCLNICMAEIKSQWSHWADVRYGLHSVLNSLSPNTQLRFVLQNEYYCPLSSSDHKASAELYFCISALWTCQLKQDTTKNLQNYSFKYYTGRNLTETRETNSSSKGLSNFPVMNGTWVAPTACTLSVKNTPKLMLLVNTK